MSGDSEGANEMTYSLEFLRKYLVMFQVRDEASTTRVFFPDKTVRHLLNPALTPKGRRSEEFRDIEEEGDVCGGHESGPKSSCLSHNINHIVVYR